MYIDLLDETYSMGTSNLPFKDFVQGGLTGVEGGLTGLAQTCHFWVSTYAPLFFSKACVLKNNSKVDETLSTGHFVLRVILIEIGHAFSIVFKIHALWRRIVINKLLVVFWSRYQQ
jgi:hypothetical protein